MAPTSQGSRAGLVWKGLVGLPELNRKLDALGALGKQGAIAYIGTNLTDPPYPYFLEYGTSRMPAYPAARPAVDEKKSEASRVASDIIGQMLTAGRADPDVMRLAVAGGALEIANRWKELARYRTGTYRRSIHVEAELVDDVEGRLR